MKFSEIEKYPTIHYMINVAWAGLPETIDRYVSHHSLQLCPDFQRGHVWTEVQQIKYIEYMLKEPDSGGKVVLFNHPGWMGSFKGDFVLVDGLQRITAALAFMNNEIKAYGQLYREFDEEISSGVEFIFQISKIKSRNHLLRWYINLNSGGTPHTDDEIHRVESMIERQV